MRTLQTALMLAAVLCTTACTELGYVEKKDYDAVQAKLTETENKLKAADKQIADFQAHRYSVYHQGWRTWRMDSSQRKDVHPADHRLRLEEIRHKSVKLPPRGLHS